MFEPLLGSSLFLKERIGVYGSAIDSWPMGLKGMKELVLTNNHMFLKDEGNHLDP
jgi:hypothetical protein